MRRNQQLTDNMKHTSVNQRVRQAFTLIELLVVIAIIGILAAMILPALSGVKRQAQIKITKAEMTQMVTAIATYQQDYSRLPASQNAAQTANPDFTFGTLRGNGPAIETGGGSPIPTGPAPQSLSQSVGTANGYQNCNAEIMDILLGGTTYPDGKANPDPFPSLNPRKSSYINAKFVNNANSAGISLVDHVYRDVWGNPFIITLDLNYDDRCVDSFYGNVYTNTGNVMIWSFGPNGKIGNNANAAALKQPDAKDNILSWQ